MPVKLASGQVTSAQAAADLEKTGTAVPRFKTQLKAAAEAAAAAPEEPATAAEGAEPVPRARGVKRKRNVAKAAAPPALNPLLTMTQEDVLVRRESRKLQLAALAEAILSNPEKHMQKSKDPHSTKVDDLAELHAMTRDDDPNIRSLAMASELAIWRDVLPAYAIKERGGDEGEGADGIGVGKNLRKETKRLRAFEGAILKGYERYIKCLDATLRLWCSEEDAKAAPVQSTTPPADRPAAQRALALTALKCMCALVGCASHFNFREVLLSAVTQRACHSAKELASPSLAALTQLFQRDVNGGAAMEAVRFVWAVVKTRGVRTPPALLDTLVHLRVTTLVRDHKSLAKQRERVKAQLSASAGVKKDDVREVLQGLKAADAEDRDERIANQTTILRDTLHICFRLLRSPRNSKVLPPVLAALGKFGHLVDVHVVQDLFASLRDLMERDSDVEDGQGAGPHLPLPAALNVIRCCLDVTSGPGKSLHMNDDVMLQYLYRVLLRLAGAGSDEATSCLLPALEAVEGALFKRKAAPAWLVAAFAHRVLVVATAVPPAGAIACLTCLRQLMAVHPDVTLALEEAEADACAAGTLQLQGTALDTSTAHGISSGMWALSQLKRHWHPHVAQEVADLLKQRPLPANVSPASQLKAYGGGAGTFVPPVAPPPVQPLQKRLAAATTAARTEMLRQVQAEADDDAPHATGGEDVEDALDMDSTQGALRDLPPAPGALSCEVADKQPYLKPYLTSVRQRREAVKAGAPASQWLPTDSVLTGRLQQALRHLDAVEALPCAVAVASSGAAPVDGAAGAASGEGKAKKRRRRGR